jgi:hypothetical protein
LTRSAAGHVKRWAAMIALAGCGRIGFESAGDRNDDAGPPDTGAPTWALVQTHGSESSALVMDQLGAHHLIIVAAQLNAMDLITQVTDSRNCNTYTEIAAAKAVYTSVAVKIFYAQNSCPGADAISLMSTTKVAALVMWEVSGIRTDDPLDTASALSAQAASAFPVGPMITTSTDGEFVVSVAMVDNTISGIHPGNEFTNDQRTNGNAWAHLTDPRAQAGSHQAQWDQPNPGAYCASAAAFRVGP